MRDMVATQDDDCCSSRWTLVENKVSSHMDLGLCSPMEGKRNLHVAVKTFNAVQYFYDMK